MSGAASIAPPVSVSGGADGPPRIDAGHPDLPSTSTLRRRFEDALALRLAVATGMLTWIGLAPVAESLDDVLSIDRHPPADGAVVRLADLDAAHRDRPVALALLSGCYRRLVMSSDAETAR